MTTKAQENARWRKEKTPVIRQYITEKKKAWSHVAGRGFTKLPGFLYEWQTDLETGAKQKLSDINFNILQETINQELKQHGLDYDLAFKNAQVAWEQEKAELISDWEKELAGIKQGRASDEEALNCLKIEVDKRRATLMEQKTAIEIEKEEYQRQLAALAGQTGDLEVELAQKKILTANKKLELIPFIEQLIDIEEDIIDKEGQILGKNQALVGVNERIAAKELEVVDRQLALAQKIIEVVTSEENLLEKDKEVLSAQEDKNAAESTLIASEEETINYRKDALRPALTDLVAKIQEYAAEIATQTGLYNQIAAIESQIVNIESGKVLKQEELLRAKRELVKILSKYADERMDLADYQKEKLGQMISDLTTLYAEYRDEILEQVGIRVNIAETDTRTIALSEVEADAIVSLASKKAATEAMRSSLDEVESDTRIARMDNKVELIGKETEDTQDLSTRETEQANDLIDQLDQLLQDELENQWEARKTNLDTRIDSAVEIEEAQRDKIHWIGHYKTDEIEKVGDINADAKLTANLEHLLAE